MKMNLKANEQKVGDKEHRGEEESALSESGW